MGVLVTDGGVRTVEADDPAAVAAAADLLAESVPAEAAGLVAYHAPGYPAYLRAALRPPPALRTVALRAVGITGEPVAVADWRVLDTQLFLNGIAVRTEHRGRGHGSRLLDDGLLLARRMGLGSLGLDVAAGNSGASALYRRFGFQDVSPSHWWHAPIEAPAAGVPLRVLDWPAFEAHHRGYGFGDLTLRGEPATLIRVRVVGDTLRVPPGGAGEAALRTLTPLLRPSRAYTIATAPPPEPARGFARFTRMRLTIG